MQYSIFKSIKTQQSMKFLLIKHLLAGYIHHLKSFKARKIFIFHHFTFYEQLKLHAQFS